MLPWSVISSCHLRLTRAVKTPSGSIPFISNDTRTLFRNGAIATHLLSVTSALFSSQRRGGGITQAISTLLYILPFYVCDKSFICNSLVPSEVEGYENCRGCTLFLPKVELPSSVTMAQKRYYVVRKFFAGDRHTPRGVSMKSTVTRPRLGLLFFLCGLWGALSAVCAPTALGQTCSSQPLAQGRVCSKPGARCSPPTVGSGTAGKCATEGLHAEALTCECQGAPTPSYNMTLTPLAPATVSKGDATSTVTVTPFNGFTGKVDFTCAVTGVGQPAPTCPAPAPVTVTGPGSASSLLTVSVSSSTGDASFTVTVNAADAHGRPADNGVQSSTVLVSHSGWIIGSSFGSAKMALIGFLILVALWLFVYLWRTRPPASR